MQPNLLILIGLIVFAAVTLRFNGWRALLWLRPSRVTVEPDAPADQMRVPEQLRVPAAELGALGFAPLGSRTERASLGPELLYYEYVHLPDRVFATLSLGRFGRPRLYYISSTEQGGMVITASYRRPSREDGKQYLAGGLPNLPADRLFKMHQRRVEGRAVAGETTLQARVELSRAWFAGPGRREIRLQNLNALVSAVMSGLLFALALAAAFAVLARR